MRKRGVSPLIASVLLIAFVIILFVLITTWIRQSALEPAMEVGEKKLASTLECINAEIEIVSVCVEAGGDFKIAVDNGNIELYGVKVRAIGEDGVSKFVDIKPTTPPVVMPYDRLLGSDSFDLTGLGAVTGVEAYPMLKGDKVCEAQKVSAISVEYKETGIC